MVYTEDVSDTWDDFIYFVPDAADSFHAYRTAYPHAPTYRTPLIHLSDVRRRAPTLF